MSEDVVIVGGGIAGSVAAAALGRSGHAPLLLERSRGAHHKVCGEFLSWDGADVLSGIGFDVAALGGAEIRCVRLFGGARAVEARLPRRAVGISRYVLDEALLAHAARCGARVERGVQVRSAAVSDAGAEIDVGGASLSARRMMLATGKSNLRGVPRITSGQPVTSDLVGFKAHYRLRTPQSAALSGAVELHLFENGGYAGLQLVENETANLCLLVPRAALDASGGLGAAVTAALQRAHVLADRLAGADMLFDRPLAISAVPYGFIHRRRFGDPAALLRLGDQFAVVHSFTGGGMAMAAASGFHAAGTAESAASYHRGFGRRVRRPVRASQLIHACLRSPPLRAAMLAAGHAFPVLVSGAASLTRVGR